MGEGRRRPWLNLARAVEPRQGGARPDQPPLGLNAASHPGVRWLHKHSFSGFYAAPALCQPLPWAPEEQSGVTRPGAVPQGRTAHAMETSV